MSPFGEAVGRMSGSSSVPSRNAAASGSDIMRVPGKVAWVSCGHRESYVKALPPSVLSI